MGNRQSCLKVGRSYSTDSPPNTPVGDDDFNRSTPGNQRNPGRSENRVQGERRRGRKNKSTTELKEETQKAAGHGSTSIKERESAKLVKDTDVNTEYQVSASKLAKTDNLVKHEGHIMFSYNWSDAQPTALKIHDHLYGEDYPLWIDIKEMKGNINEKMAYAVENSCIVLMFCSPKYEESHNCQKEASYADTLKKRIIPIYTQKGYAPKGNCGLITAGRLYFDFSSGSFDENMKKLIKELGPATTYKKSKSDDMSSTSSSLPKQHERKDLICGNGIKEEAVRKVLAEQDIYRDPDLQLQIDNISKDSIPWVNPKYLILAFYQGAAALKDEAYRPSNEKLKLGETREIQFKDITKQKGEKKFIGLIGYPGSGKSTCSKRLAKCEDLVYFHRKILDINYTDKLTLRELLLDKAYSNLSKVTCKNAFQWILDNQEKCAFIFDGLDQAEWELVDKAAKENYETPQTVENLVTCLCNGTFLRNSLLIFTSRPHTFAKIHSSARPDKTIFIADLSPEDAETLFFAYTGSNANQLWQNLMTSAPQLISLCYNPLMCQLVAAAVTNPSEAIGDILTMTQTFATVLGNLRRSDNTKFEDIEKLTDKLSRLAYKATIKSTVVINRDQLEEENLDPCKVQDIIVMLLARKGVTGKVFDGDAKLYFSHQTFQEYYTAKL